MISVIVSNLPGLWMSFRQRGRWESWRRRWWRGGCSSRRCCRGTRGGGSPSPSPRKSSELEHSTPRTGSSIPWNRFWRVYLSIWKILPWCVKEEEGECGGDKDGGQVALLKVSNINSYFLKDLGGFIGSTSSLLLWKDWMKKQFRPFFAAEMPLRVSSTFPFLSSQCLGRSLLDYYSYQKFRNLWDNNIASSCTLVKR